LFIPLIFIGMVVLGSFLYLLRLRSYSRTALLWTVLPLTVRVLFLLYPLLANVAFSAFSCYDPLDNDGPSYLIADVEIVCGSTEHATAKASAGVALGIYVFGVFLLKALLLRCVYTAILNQTPTHLSNAIAFLHGEYEPWASWWELCTSVAASKDRFMRGQQLRSTYHFVSTLCLVVLCCAGEMIRRIVLVGVFVLIQRGSLSQLLFGT
jgi:hypothetical protein